MAQGGAMRAFFSRTDKFWVGLSDFCCLTLCLKVFSMRKKLDSRIHMKHTMRQHYFKLDFRISMKHRLRHKLCFMMCLMQIRESNSSSCLKLCFIFIRESNFL